LVATTGPFHTIAIVGTGLIGGSLGLALRARRPDLHLIGVDLAGEAARAVEAGAVHEAVDSLPAAVADADLVMVATPLAAALRVIEEMAPHLRSGAVVSDVGSVKRAIVEHAGRVLPPEVSFVGGHPMAGAERGGIAHADGMLFENAAWVLCPPAGDPSARPFEESFAPLIDVVEATGARAFLLEAERHDRIAAAVSHLPQLLSVALVNEALSADEAARTLAAGGFRDMTRIASSPFDLWREILTANQGAALDVLARFIDRLQGMRYALAAEEWETLSAAFEDAQRRRADVPVRSKGFLRPLAEVVVRVEDRPGALLHLVQALTDAGLDIKDAELLTVRMGVEGAFRFGFSRREDAEKAVKALAAQGYSARFR
jgi:prephenate dehydrogenase